MTDNRQRPDLRNLLKYAKQELETFGNLASARSYELLQALEALVALNEQQKAMNESDKHEQTRNIIRPL